MTLFCANKFTSELKQSLLSTSTPEKAQKMQRFFPTYIHCAGAMAGDIATVIKHFHAQNSDLSPQQVLLISETLLKDAQYSEEVLLAFGLLNKLVKKHFDDDLLNRFTYWLEHYTSNWAHVDDLCLKTVYNFLLSRTYLIEDIQQWNQSNIAWCRRASNVSWVKFINRPIGKKTYRLNLALVFENCDKLMSDSDVYVQKSIGWLLKAASIHHQSEVIAYLQANAHRMEKSTLYYACEKLSSPLNI
jgi:3-methyladenine DNA glycosylase AlkD